MIWWDWTGSKRLALLAAMLAVAAFPWVVLGWLPHEWRAFIGGTAFLMLQLMFGWFLFVGLFTGRIPARGGSESRIVTPVWFWGVAATYAVILIFLYS
ncbi:hypothetical protein H5J25_14020 [Sphingomonas aliaeris]|uniref:Uncharacterized protein n=1 Tax=Sphingomonas aliaeris TaxID=2759526 RepID=A0A974S3L3_9SPHN|nr:hypothetical protein [Sphingomonas aliaeris]QQV76556.1 hypothetical protein H5J25_14020 [Sphingomonas aliaeris]